MFNDEIMALRTNILLDFLIKKSSIYNLNKNIF